MVTVVLVAHNPGAWFEEVLRSIRGQDYPSLDLVVIDAASDIAVTPRVHDVLPEATIVPLVANQGFAKNANVILDHGTIGRYLLICHDDVALGQDCVRRLVEEATRSNAGIVGPKLLDWSEPRRLLHVGLSCDKTGQVADIAEPGEYDQEQHDAVRDVFAVPGAVTLVRSDLFGALGGFDEGIEVQGEDMDLCWRAHVLGARVLINPAATARHREDLSSRLVGYDRSNFQRRHRIRSVLSNYGLWHTIRVVPQTIFLSLFAMVAALLQGRISEVRDIAQAWIWNLVRLPSIISRRRKLSRIRRVADTEVRALQVAGFQGVQSWRRQRADRRAETFETVSATEALAVHRHRRRWNQIVGFTWVATTAVVLFGSRRLWLDGIPVMNEFVSFPDTPGSLLAEWGTTWRSAGLGSEGPGSLLHFVIGFGGIGFFGQMGLLRTVLILGLIAAGAIGAFRMLSPFESAQAQIVALVVYVAAPLPYNSLHSGSWGALICYAALPWLAKRLATAAQLAPFGDEDPTMSRRVLDTIALAMLMAAAALVEPLIAIVIAVLVAGWIVGGLATRSVGGLGRMIAIAVVAGLGAVVLLLPELLHLWQSGAERNLLGEVGGSDDQSSLLELFRLASGPHGRSVLGWALPVVPALAMIVAFGQRLVWAVRSLFVVVGAVALAWMSSSGRLGLEFASEEVLLAPAALGFAFAAGMTAVAFARDLRRYRFGWRQLVPFLALAALGATALAGLQGSVQGRFEVAEGGYETVLGFLDDKAPAHARIAWIGDADVLPVPGWEYDDTLSWSLTQARTPTILDGLRPVADDVAVDIRDTIEQTLAGSSGRLGQQLALYGVRYVILVESNAPDPFGTIEAPIPPAIAERLGEQLDLVKVKVREGATIYENRSYVPIVAAFPQRTITAASIDEPRAALGTSYALALPTVRSLRSYEGAWVGGELYFSIGDPSRWAVSQNGADLNPTVPFAGSATFDVAPNADIVLSHSNDGIWIIAAWVQLGGWGLVSIVLTLGRRRRS